MLVAVWRRKKKIRDKKMMAGKFGKFVLAKTINH